MKLQSPSRTVPSRMKAPVASPSGLPWARPGTAEIVGANVARSSFPSSSITCSIKTVPRMQASSASLKFVGLAAVEHPVAVQVLVSILAAAVVVVLVEFDRVAVAVVIAPPDVAGAPPHGIPVILVKHGGGDVLLVPHTAAKRVDRSGDPRSSSASRITSPSVSCTARWRSAHDSSEASNSATTFASGDGLRAAVGVAGAGAQIRLQATLAAKTASPRAKTFGLRLPVQGESRDVKDTGSCCRCRPW